MTPADLRKLEHSHRFCLKHMQGLPRRTPTNVTLSAINAVPMETVIDHKKTFQHLDNQNLGFIHDINRILTKYALHHVLDRYLSDGVFPSKCAWKRIIYEKTIQRSNSDLFHKCVDISLALHWYCVLMVWAVYGPWPDIARNCRLFAEGQWG